MISDDEGWDDASSQEAASQTIHNQIFTDLLNEVVNLLTKLNNLDNEFLLSSALQATGWSRVCRYQRWAVVQVTHFLNLPRSVFTGAFAEHYYSSPGALGVVFPIILLRGLQMPETVLYATRALKDICKENATLLGPYAGDILSLCHKKLLDGSLNVSRPTLNLLSSGLADRYHAPGIIFGILLVSGNTKVSLKSRYYPTYSTGEGGRGGGGREGGYTSTWYMVHGTYILTGTCFSFMRTRSLLVGIVIP